MKSYKEHFSKALSADGDRLHFAAHSHHLWPDCTEVAHNQAWIDAATLADDKWDRTFSQVIPEAQAHIARLLSLPDPKTICFAPNTHEFLVRLHSALPAMPSILTTDAEFHSFSRQRQRWEEAENTEFEVIAAEPFEDFGARFLKSAARYEHDMIYISQVFFNSGYVIEIIDALVEIVRDRKTLLVIDGYHAFMALPVSLRKIHDRVFYIAGGYKYAMAGEGVCFMHCPPGFAMRPVNTGWFAGFSDLKSGVEKVGYATDGRRFAGATFDASGLHRFNAVQGLLKKLRLSVLALHERIQVLQNQFLDGLVASRIDLGEFIPGAGGNELGHFLTFRNKDAELLCDVLGEQGVMVDSRKDRLRFGFAIYHDPDDIVELLRRLSSVAPKAKGKADSAIDSAIASAIATESRVTGPFEIPAQPADVASDDSTDVEASAPDADAKERVEIVESEIVESEIVESEIVESEVVESEIRASDTRDSPMFTAESSSASSGSITSEASTAASGSIASAPSDRAPGGHDPIENEVDGLKSLDSEFDTSDGEDSLVAENAAFAVALATHSEELPAKSSVRSSSSSSESSEQAAKAATSAEVAAEPGTKKKKRRKKRK